MIQINLLPWRESARKRKKVQFLSLLALGAFLALIFMFVLHMNYHHIYSMQNKVNTSLQDAINVEQSSLNSVKDQQENMENVMSQLRDIAALYQKSYQAVDFLNKIVPLIPPTVALKKIRREGSNITLEGLATSEDEVTRFMQNIAKSPDFFQPVLTSTQFEKGNKTNYSNFQIQVVQKAANNG